MSRIAINGFGRIGRAFFKLALEEEDLDIIAINDLGDPENMAYLLKYDSVYGPSGLDVRVGEGKLVVNGTEVMLLSEKDPSKLPWKELKIDVALEATGFFASYEKSQMHLQAGAKRVVVSAPVKDVPPSGIVGATVIMGVNDEKLQTCDISSNASCTTNAGGPLVTILDEKIGIEKAILNTVHGYTSSQNIVDSPNKKIRRGRAAGVNIVPSSTGAALATTKAYPALEGKFDGIALRVPVVSGSIVDITFIAKKDVTVESVNEVLVAAAHEDRWKGIFTVTNDPLVSTDILGSPFASIVDLEMTRVVDGNLVKVLAWYDNEVGYTNTLVQHVITTAKYAK
ncbi:type I glyceraldehyde-3-phosphate dehydrogenase [Candidatus Wolfebacteria bacterium]|nr:type I glyceraldehyde-3-phosphate dehydrogenase [Candidatus Wolfebacteria bacterium]